jgi:hypothetical protein
MKRILKEFRRYSPARRRRVGRAIRKELEARGLTLTAIAHTLGVSVSLVHHVVYGDKGRVDGRWTCAGRGLIGQRVRSWIAFAIGRSEREVWPRLTASTIGRPRKQTEAGKGKS